MIQIEFDAEQLAYRLGNLGSALNDLRPVWPEVDTVVREFMKKVFESEGEYGGTHWAPLNEAYAQRKARDNPGKTILRLSDWLYGSFTNAQHPEHVMNVGPTFGEFGSKVLYAAAHQYGYPPRKLPARPMVREFTKEEGERVVDIIMAYLFKKMRLKR